MQDYKGRCWFVMVIIAVLLRLPFTAAVAAEPDAGARLALNRGGAGMACLAPGHPPGTGPGFSTH